MLPKVVLAPEVAEEEETELEVIVAVMKVVEQKLQEAGRDGLSSLDLECGAAA